MIDWKIIDLEQLRRIYNVLGQYIEARQTEQDRQELEQLQQEREIFELDLQELQAQLAAHEEMVSRLKDTLKLPISSNGEESGSSTKEGNISTDLPVGSSLLDEFSDVAGL